jgi:methylated-DNA-[protein]-cysteine S-methyltransferase
MPTHVILDSPIGPLTLACSDGMLTGLYLAAPQPGRPRHEPGAGVLGSPDDPAREPFAAAADQLAAYFAGRLTEFTLPLAPAGTPFQRRVWAGLCTIPYGETWSYGQLAAKVANSGAARAVGLANGRNPIAVVIPCHRVIGSDGSLTGYGGGLERKRYLLDLEAGVRPRP